MGAVGVSLHKKARAAPTKRGVNVKKLLFLLLTTLALASAALASTEEALEACRAKNGLLPDAPGGDSYSAVVLLREMRLRLLRGDRDRFDRLYRLMRAHFQSPLLLLYPRLDARLRPAACENSVGIDLMACGVLLDASEKWNEPAYEAHALRLARRILRFNIYHDVLIDGASWKERRSGIFTLYEPSHRISLASIDVRALRQLQKRLPAWEAVAQRCLGILLGGGDLYERRLVYDVDRRAYTESRTGAVDGLWIMTHLLDGGLAPLRALDKLRERLRVSSFSSETDGEGTLTASILGAYALARAGQEEPSRAAFLALDDAFERGDGLFRRSDGAPDIGDNLLFLTVKELLGTVAR